MKFKAIEDISLKPGIIRDSLGVFLYYHSPLQALNPQISRTYYPAFNRDLADITAHSLYEILYPLDLKI